MINTKWILSCLVAVGTLLTASAQAQTFATTINTTLLGAPQGTYNVTLVESPLNTFAVSIKQTAGGPSAFVDGISLSFFNGAANQTVLSGSGGTAFTPFTFAFDNEPPLQSSAVFSDTSGSGIPGPNQLPGNTSVNSFNSFSGTVKLVPGSSVSVISVGLTGNGGSGNAFASSVVPESNASILLLAALLPIGILVARRRTSKSAA